MIFQNLSEAKRTKYVVFYIDLYEHRKYYLIGDANFPYEAIKEGGETVLF